MRVLDLLRRLPFRIEQSDEDDTLGDSGWWLTVRAAESATHRLKGVMPKMSIEPDDGTVDNLRLRVEGSNDRWLFDPGAQSDDLFAATDRPLTERRGRCKDRANRSGWS